jgi:hypothetical protein
MVWNTRFMHNGQYALRNGEYSLQAAVVYKGGHLEFSPSVPITLDNPSAPVSAARGPGSTAS